MTRMIGTLGNYGQLWLQQAQASFDCFSFVQAYGDGGIVVYCTLAPMSNKNDQNKMI